MCNVKERKNMQGGTSFEHFYLDLTKIDSAEHLAEALGRDRFVTFDSIHSREDLLHLSNVLGTIVAHRDSDEDGVTRIVKRNEEHPQDGYWAFTASHLNLHTDGSGVPQIPTLVVLWCAQPAREGGISLFVDGKKVYQVLSEQYPRILTVLKAPNSAIFGDLRSSVFQILENGNMCIRFRYDSLGYFAAPVSAVLPTFLELLSKYLISFSLQAHQGYIIQNGRWLHGRTAFHGAREMYRVLVRTTDETPISERIHLGFNSAF
jgi:alpha-ketoglutarate-dependent taurine dioxygenase